MALPRYKSFLGIAKEASRTAGTSPVAVTNLDLTGVSVNAPTVTYDSTLNGGTTTVVTTASGTTTVGTAAKTFTPVLTSYYVVSLFAKSAATLRSGNLLINWYNASNVLISQQTKSFTFSTSDQLVSTASVQPPATTAKFDVTIDITGANASETFYYSAPKLTSSSGVAATDFIPVNSIAPFDNIKYLDDNNWRGSMVETYGTVQGNIHAEFEFGGDVFPDTIGYAVAGVLGDITTTGSSAPYTHAVAVKNSGTGQTTSYTLTDYNAYNARQFAGCQFGSLDFKFSADGLLDYTAMAQGFQSATATTPSPSFSSVTNVPSWTGVTTIGGSVTAKLAEGNVAITRPLTAIYTVDGSQSPYQIFQGAVSVDGSLKLIFEDDTDLTRYLTNTQPSLDIAFSQGTGAALTKVQFTMTKCAFQVAKIDRGQDYVTLDVTYKAIANATDVGASSGYSPIKVTLQNAKASGVYA
jgi:hypothetical protein